jgi:hypothetical protein
MVNHPNRSKHAMKPGTHDIGKGWFVTYLPAQPSGSPEIMTFFHSNGDTPIVLGAESIKLLREAMKLA